MTNSEIPMMTTISTRFPSLLPTPFMTKLIVALESKTVFALIMGAIDNSATMREMFGHVSFDVSSNTIERMLYERFGDYSLRAGDLFLILVTGQEALTASRVALSVRKDVEAMNLDDRFPVTMHFAVTHASSDWTKKDGFGELYAALEAVKNGQYKTNRVWVETTP